jgi:hypothetical protein
MIACACLSYSADQHTDSQVQSSLKMATQIGYLVQERFPVGWHPSGGPRRRLTFWMRVRRKQFHSIDHRLALIVEEPILAGLKTGYDRMPSRHRML